MRIMIVADMRSPHSIGWVKGLLKMGALPLVVSSRRLNPAERSAIPISIRELIIHEPSDLLSRARSLSTASPGSLSLVRSLARRGRTTNNDSIAQQLSTPEGTGRIELPLELRIARELGRKVLSLAHTHNPDLIHALRIPFEGISITSMAATWPTAISIWGQDLARQASASLRLAEATRKSLMNIRGLHADCRRDIELAAKWGAPPTAVKIIAAGNMGYDVNVFNSGASLYRERDFVFCPRGPGSGINYAGFLRIADRITRTHPRISFVAARLSGVTIAEDIRRRSAHPERIILTGNLSSQEMADIYRRSIAVVSPSVNDGTPNSVLEGMSCGAVPLVGDIAPLRELLQETMAGSLVDPLDEAEMEKQIIKVLDAPEEEWLQRSAEAQRISTSGWSRGATFGRVEAWYEQLAVAGARTL